MVFHNLSLSTIYNLLRLYFSFVSIVCVVVVVAAGYMSPFVLCPRILEIVMRLHVRWRTYPCRVIESVLIESFRYLRQEVDLLA